MHRTTNPDGGTNYFHLGKAQDPKGNCRELSDRKKKSYG